MRLAVSDKFRAAPLACEERVLVCYTLRLYRAHMLWWFGIEASQGNWAAAETGLLDPVINNVVQGLQRCALCTWWPS